MIRNAKLPLLAFVLAATVAVAHAASGGPENDALTIQQARIPLAQAIAIAEQHANGKASKAEFEHSKTHGRVYEVEVASGSKVFDVRVDADKGAVISSAEDKAD